MGFSIVNQPFWGPPMLGHPRIFVENHENSCPGSAGSSAQSRSRGLKIEEMEQ